MPPHGHAPMAAARARNRKRSGRGGRPPRRRTASWRGPAYRSHAELGSVLLSGGLRSRGREGKGAIFCFVLLRKQASASEQVATSDRERPAALSLIQSPGWTEGRAGTSRARRPCASRRKNLLHIDMFAADSHPLIPVSGSRKTICLSGTPSGREGWAWGSIAAYKIFLASAAASSAAVHLDKSLDSRERPSPGDSLRYKIFFPNADNANSTAKSAVRLCSSMTGLTSTISKLSMRPWSAMISMARWASR
jgi:hypothetical protein